MHPTTQTHKPQASLFFIFSSMLYSSSFSSTMIGEYIGMESCLDLNVNNINEGDQHQHDEGGYYHQRRKRDNDQRSMIKKKEFPPLITSLARTENQPSHMPWVLKRYYTNDGRLILREEKVRHHEYFKAHRADGRLTLQLVALDEDDEADSICRTYENENEDQKEHCINADQENTDDDDNRFDLVKLVSYNENQYEQCNGSNGDQEEADVVKSASPVNESSPVGGGGGGGGNGKCLIYSNVSKISFEVPAIRPVH